MYTLVESNTLQHPTVYQTKKGECSEHGNNSDKKKIPAACKHHCSAARIEDIFYVTPAMRSVHD